MAAAEGLPDPAPVISAGAVTLDAIRNQYVRHSRKKVEANELSKRRLDEIIRESERMVAAFGSLTRPEDLNTTRFANWRASWKGIGPVTAGNRVRNVRAFWNWAYEAELIDVPMRFGPDFKIPKKKRAGRAVKLMTPDEIRLLLGAADPIMRAWVLLGINAAYIPVDLARLTRRDVDDALSHPERLLVMLRQKSDMYRAATLWEETAEALAAARDLRPKPADRALRERFFLSPRGLELVRDSTNTSYVAPAFGRLKERAGVDRPGVVFHWFRYTFRTYAGRCRDQPAVRAVTGHAASALKDELPIDDVYTHEVEIDRIRSATDAVAVWLGPIDG